MTDDFSERRKDDALREAIDDLRDDLHELHSHDRVYARVLKEIACITDSNFCFAVQSHGAGENLGVAWMAGYSNPTQELVPLKKPVFRANDVKAVQVLLSTMKLGVPRVIERSDIADIDTLHELMPDVSQILAIPLSDGEEVFALLCFSRAAAPYQVDIARRLQPLITVCSSVLRIIDSKNLDTIAEKRLFLDSDTWRENFNTLEQLSPLAMLTLSQEYKILRINPAAEKIFGLNSQDVSGKDIVDLIPERFPGEHKTQTFVSSTLKLGHENSIPIEGTSPSRQSIPLELSLIRYLEYKQPRIVLLLRDKTEITSAREELKSELQRFRAVADLAPMGILQTDATWNTIYANDRWQQISGQSLDSLQRLGWLSSVHEEDAQNVLDELRAKISNSQEFQTECRLKHTSKPGHTWVQLHVRPLFNPQSELQGLVATLIDTSYHHSTEEKLRNLAERDALTGLANRMLFYDRLEQALKRVPRHGPLALLCLDLDGFKNINDSLGHDAGDQLLRDVALRLKSCVRAEDTVARVGGDEFTILLQGIESTSVAAEIAEKILKRLEAPVRIQQQEVFISTSIGICVETGDQNCDANTLLKQADMALYRAKAAGRNNFQYYSKELEEASRNRLELGNSLHRALSRAEFEVFYQLQAEVSTGDIVGAEALLRWRHHSRGLLMPSEFMPLLDETGLVSPVSRWVWHQAFMQQRAWIDQGLMHEDACLSVNISPRQFRDPLFIVSMEGAIADSGLSGENIIVEITETALVQDNSYTQDILNKLKSLGILIALDDFGTGYASLSYLKRFPIDIIKIDRSFVIDLMRDKEDRAITQAVLALGRSLDLSVFAEGVENKEVLNQLLRWGCDYYQGYFLNKPSTPNEVAVQLRSHLRSRGAKLTLQ
jgi:diguanylate cyclase (GGDEF)-like protein/PAS domain S-box-containing protein